LDRRGPPRDPEPRVPTRQELRASTQDGPWKSGSEGPPAPTGVATGAESQDTLEDEHDAEAGWLISVGADLRSFLGIAALMIFALPAVVLVLTLLGEDSKPVPMKTPTARGGGSAITQQDRTEGGERKREDGDRLLGRHDASPGTRSKGDRAAPTRQTGLDQRGSNQVQETPVAAVPAAAPAAGSPEPVSSVAASSAPTSTAAASSPASSAPASVPAGASGEAPTASTPSVAPHASTDPTTTQPSSAPAESAPPVAQQASSTDPSAPAIAGGMPASGAAPVEDFQEEVPDANSYDPSEYAGGSLR
jgi:hypothetical protein